MNILYWNLQEAVSKTFFRHITDLINTHGPVIVVLLETKVQSDRAQIIFPLDGFEGFAAVFFAFGNLTYICCFLKVDVQVQVLAINDQCVFVTKMRGNMAAWLVTAIYASPLA